MNPNPDGSFIDLHSGKGVITRFMAKLDKGQQNALRAYLDGIAIESDNRGAAINMEGYGTLESHLQRASPWKELLSSWDAAVLVSNVAVSLSSSIPADYQGRLADAPNSKPIIDAIQKRVTTLLEALPRPYAVAIQLPGVDAWGVPHIPLLNKISLVTRTKEIEQPQGLLGGAMGQTRKTTIRAAFLEIQSPGFANMSYAS